MRCEAPGEVLLRLGTGLLVQAEALLADACFRPVTDSRCSELIAGKQTLALSIGVSGPPSAGLNQPPSLRGGA
jgi:hypothetical protein